MKKLKIFTFVFILLLSFSCVAQNSNNNRFMNLDFERSTTIGAAKYWFSGGKGFSIFVDSTEAFSGNQSLCIEKVSEGNFGVATSSFPIEEARGKYLTYSGYIKTENITNGYAGLWWRVDGQEGSLNFDNMHDRGPNGTSDWTKYTIEFKIDENLTNINFGVLLPGDGKAWFDNLSIELDGEKYEQKEPEIIKLSSDHITWLKNNVNTFETAEPIEDDSDLDFLKEIVGDAKIVSLGEGTHGTSEFFKMKHRITKYLVENMGFTVFAIEANMPEAAKVNDYVLKGIGNSKDVLKGLYFWTWNTQEVLDMIEWMRDYNNSKNGGIEFWGFDAQYPKVAVQNVLRFLKEFDADYYKKAEEKLNKINTFFNEVNKMKSKPGSILFEPYLNYAKDVHKHISKNIDKYNLNGDKDSTERCIQNSRIILQTLMGRMNGHQSRDESMALNVKWIREKMPEDTKIILWAHNAHVSKSAYNNQSMGAFLNKYYGNEMVVMGFGFNKGEYTAAGKNGLGIYTTSLAEPGSIEWMMQRLKHPRVFLDLRKIKNSPLKNVFNKQLEFRSIGAMAIDYAFRETKITNEFDVLIYFEDTKPSACFNVTRK